MHLDQYLDLLQATEALLADGLWLVARRHAREPEVRDQARELAAWSEGKTRALDPFIARARPRTADPEINRLRNAMFHEPRTGALGLLRDLHDATMLAEQAALCWAVVQRTAEVLRNPQLVDLAAREAGRTEQQQNYLRARLRAIAPTTLAGPGEDGDRSASVPLVAALDAEITEPLHLPARLVR